jgi:membrane protein
MLEERLPEGLVARARALRALPPVSFVLRLLADVSADDVSGLAAEMAYRFLFAFFPFLIFLTAVVGFISVAVGFTNLFTVVMGFITVLFPPDVQNVLGDWVSGVLLTHSTGLLTFGAAGALWGAAGGIGTFMKGLNRAYRVAESRPFWQTQALSLMWTAVMTVIMLVGVGLYTFGRAVGEMVAVNFGLGPGFLAAWDWIRVPAVDLGLVLALALMYRELPNVEVSWRTTLPGALLATVGWVVLTAGFSFYVGHFGSYDKTFGSLGAAVVLMVWMYLVGMILLLGGELNAAIRGRNYDVSPPG